MGVTFKKLSGVLLIQNMTEIKINTTDQNTPKMGVENCCNCHCHRVPVTLRDTFFQDPFFSGNWDEFDQMRRDMIAESRLVWQKFDDEMKQLESRSFSRFGGQDKIEQGQGNINNTASTEKDVINATTAKETEKHENEKLCIKSSAINEQEKEKFRKNKEREIKTVVENNIDNTTNKSSNVSKDLFNGEVNEDFSLGRRSSWFSPMKLVRFPSLFGEEKKFESRFSGFKDENVIKVKDDDKAFEITMDTSMYKPDELTVNVMNNNLTVEAKHNEQSEDGRSFISKQFLRKYTLPRGCKQDSVVSNLSSDGVLVITAPKIQS